MFQEIITLADARERGMKRYFTGEPCKHGHVAERIVSGRVCVECSKSSSEKQRNENPENVRSNRRRYAEKNIENERARGLRYREENAEKLRESSKKYRIKNAEKLREKQSMRKQENRDKYLEIQKKWRVKNPDKVRYNRSKRRAVELNLLPPWFNEIDQFVITEAADLAMRRESITGYKWNVDHMIPLRSRNASGLHCASNLQVIPATLNMRKSNKMMFTEPGEWIKAL